MSTPSPSTPPPLHPIESEVMDEVWRAGRATVREVLTALNAREAKQRAYTTVMTIMQRLDEKGLLRRSRIGKTDLYEPRLSHEEYKEARAAAEVGALVEQYGDAALVHFARQMATVDPKQRERLRRVARRG